MGGERGRCAWATTPPMIEYHDLEWGVPVHDDRKLFEFLILEGAQAGLSWETILNKREYYRRAFSRFEPRLIARYDKRRIARLLDNPGIVRNRAKVEAAVTNARVVLDLREAVDGGLDALVWSFAPEAARRPVPVRLADVPASTVESTALATALRRHGFRFVGPTTAYAAMQACGLVDDHLAGCHARGGNRSGPERRGDRPGEGGSR